MSSIYPSDFAFQPRFVQIFGHQIAYLDVGSGERTLLMIHGNPVAGYVYARLMTLLSPHFRCVVPDLLGFGMSDKPAEPAAYSLPQHIAIMREFVRLLDLQGVVLVVHDWGGPIGLATAVTEPHRYTHLIILNTMTEAPMRIMPIYKIPFHFFLRTRRLFDYLVKQQNLFQKMGIGIMDTADQQVYFRVNHSPDTRMGIASFPRMIPYKKTHPNTPLLREVLDSVIRWNIPALVMFSDHDSVFSADQGERFAQKLVNGTFQLISGPKHFLQYERPSEIAAKMITFLGEIN